MIKKFSKNETGRDFIVGDIHGCFTQLKDKLNEIGFDETKDRLFSTGDLVDRGLESLDVVKWLTKPWFHAVRGNHEQMAIDTFNDTWDAGNYYINGGAWFLILVPEEQRAYVDLFESMPFIIEIETESGPVGIVHAEYHIGDWNDKEKHINDKSFQSSLIWSRTRADFGETWRVKNIDWIYVGHTVMLKKTVLGNHVYIDTGAVFGGELTIIEI
jgi:serine/threonine protein phosphatase 1